MISSSDNTFRIGIPFFIPDNSFAIDSLIRVSRGLVGTIKQTDVHKRSVVPITPLVESAGSTIQGIYGKLLKLEAASNAEMSYDFQLHTRNVFKNMSNNPTAFVLHAIELETEVTCGEGMPITINTIRDERHKLMSWIVASEDMGSMREIREIILHKVGTTATLTTG